MKEIKKKVFKRVAKIVLYEFCMACVFVFFLVLIFK